MFIYCSKEYVYNVVVLDANYESFSIPIVILQPVLSYFPSLYNSISLLASLSEVIFIDEQCWHLEQTTLSGFKKSFIKIV